MYSIKLIQQLTEDSIEDNNPLALSAKTKSVLLDVFDRDITGRYLDFFQNLRSYLQDPSKDKINEKLKIEAEALGYAIDKKTEAFKESANQVASSMSGQLEALSESSLSSGNNLQSREMSLRIKELLETLNTISDADIALRDNFKPEHTPNSIWRLEHDYSIDEIAKQIFSAIDEI